MPRKDILCHEITRYVCAPQTDNCKKPGGRLIDFLLERRLEQDNDSDSSQSKTGEDSRMQEPPEQPSEDLIPSPKCPDRRRWWNIPISLTKPLLPSKSNERHCADEDNDSISSSKKEPFITPPHEAGFTQMFKRHMKEQPTESLEVRRP